MNIGISHLAFENNNAFEEHLYALKSQGIEYLELVFSKLDQKLLDIIRSNDTHIKSTQSVLYGSQVNSLTEERFYTHMLELFNKCQNMGISKITLGSPKQRIGHDRSALLRTFEVIDSVLNAFDITLCIEPNSSVYGGDFFYSVDEIVKFIEAGSFRNIKTMIDTHNLILEGCSPSEVFREYMPYIAHVHVSEIGLTSFKFSRDHGSFADILHASNYDGLIIYELMPHTDLVLSMSEFKMIYG